MIKAYIKSSKGNLLVKDEVTTLSVVLKDGTTIVRILLKDIISHVFSILLAFDING